MGKVCDTCVQKVHYGICGCGREYWVKFDPHVKCNSQEECIKQSKVTPQNEYDTESKSADFPNKQCPYCRHQLDCPDCSREAYQLCAKFEEMKKILEIED